MSRTFRRKNLKPKKWITEDYVRTEDGWKWVSYEGEELAKRIAIDWHSDASNAAWQHPPSWFCNQFGQRPFRAHQRQVIQKMMKTGDFEDYVFLDPKNCDWEWT